MKKMPQHPRLFLRNGTYYHRAVVPKDIIDSYGKTEETFSLKTKDKNEALKRVRKAASEVDDKFDEHRNLQQLSENPLPVSKLNDEQLTRIGNVYYATLLEEDEESRDMGFGETAKETKHLVSSKVVIEEKLLDNIEEGLLKPATKLTPHKSTFEEFEAVIDFVDDNLRHDHARGKYDNYRDLEINDALYMAGLNVVLGDSCKKSVAKKLQETELLAHTAIKQRNKGDVVATPKVEQGALDAGTPLLSQVYEKWHEEKSRISWREKTSKEHSAYFRHLISVIKDKSITSYKKEDARKFKQVLLSLPANWTKLPQLQGLDIGAAAEKAKRLSLTPMSVTNINKILSSGQSLWNWAENNYDDMPSNIFKGMALPKNTTAREERNPFTVGELNKIFAAPVYKGCKSPHHYSQAGDQVLKDNALYWAPLISLFSGARLGEILQLRTSDIQQDSGIWYLDINENTTDKKVKNKSSIRRLPIHPFLASAGLLELHERSKAHSGDMLFPDVTLGKDGYYSSPFSKKFKRFLETCGAKTSKTSFHSFRHNFEDACRNCGVPHELMNSLQGHTGQGMSKRYGSGFDLKNLYEAISQIDYAEVELGHITPA